MKFPEAGKKYTKSSQFVELYTVSCCCSVAKWCLILCKPMSCSRPGFPALPISLNLLKLMSTELMMPSNHHILFGLFSFRPQSFPASGSFPMSWLFTYQVLDLQLQHQSFQWIFRVDFLWDLLVWPPCCPRDSQESSPAPQSESVSSICMHVC